MENGKAPGVNEESHGFKSQPLSGLKSACKAVSYDWSGVTEAAVYPDNHRGYLGSKYCGD